MLTAHEKTVADMLREAYRAQTQPQRDDALDRVTDFIVCCVPKARRAEFCDYVHNTTE